MLVYHIGRTLVRFYCRLIVLICWASSMIAIARALVSGSALMCVLMRMPFLFLSGRTYPPSGWG